MLNSHGGLRGDMADEEEDIGALLGVGSAGPSTPGSPPDDASVPLPLFPLAPPGRASPAPPPPGPEAAPPPPAHPSLPVNDVRPTDLPRQHAAPHRKSPAPPPAASALSLFDGIESHPVDAKAAKAPVEDVLGHLKAQLAVVGHDLELGKSEKAWGHSQGSSPLSPLGDSAAQAFENRHAGHLGTSRVDVLDPGLHGHNPLTAPQHAAPPAEDDDFWQPPVKTAATRSPLESRDAVWEEPIADTAVDVQLLQNGAPRSEVTHEAQLDVAFKRLRLHFDLFVRKMLHSGHTGCVVGLALGSVLSVVPSFLFIWYFLIPFSSSSDVELSVMATVSFGIMCASIFASCGYILIRRRPATWDFDGRLRRRNPECIALAEADHAILRLLHDMPAEGRLAYLQKEDPAGLRRVYLQCLERMGRVEAPPEEVTGGPTASTAGLVLKARFQAQLQREHVWQNFGDCWF
eukprot:EG_transcript_6462